jgi:hypothetical protein
MHRLLFAAAAIAAIAALAASRIDGQQMRSLMTMLTGNVWLPATLRAHLSTCNVAAGRMVQGGAAEYQEAVAR